MGRTACTEPQYLYKGALYLNLVPVQGGTLPYHYACTRVHTLTYHYACTRVQFSFTSNIFYDYVKQKLQ